MILAAVRKKTFVRTPFHILISGLAFTDLCTGLIAQPLYAAVGLMYIDGKDYDSIIKVIDTTGVSIAIYYDGCTCLDDRWLYCVAVVSLLS